MLLAIDTSAGTSVAVVDRDRGIIAEADSFETMRHAEVVGTLISEVLDASGIAVTELSAVAAGIGPGPFTGLRVGIAAARAFAFGIGKPVVNLASHDAIAFACYRDGHDGPLLVVTDARRREVYWSRYDGVDEFGIPVRVEGPAIAKAAGPPYPELPRADMLAAREQPADAGSAGHPIIASANPAATVSAGALGMLAELSWQHKRPFAGAEPLYLRSPDITPSAGPKRVSA